MLNKLNLKKLSGEQKFMVSVLLVNVGNYLYNLLLGRVLGPEKFSDAAILITFLLVLSFVAMTFQLTATKFSVLLTDSLRTKFLIHLKKIALLIGIVLGVLILGFSRHLQDLLNTTNSLMFTIFGIGVPIYFILSVNRGFYQGTKNYEKLATTYQTEMISRLLITMLCLYVLPLDSSLIVALGLLLSFFFGLIPYRKHDSNSLPQETIDPKIKRNIYRFFFITCFYELTQIIINNSDILLVKHYFDSYSAGLYASIALIGRLVYFVTWMFIMLLLPKVVSMKKNNEDYRSLFFTYLTYIFILTVSIVGVCYLFPELVVRLMFGKAYLSVSSILWKYAIATSLFALSNLFAYYFLSLDKYFPVVLSGLLGILQVYLISIYHQTLEQVVLMQIYAMLVLLIVQILFFTYDYLTQKKIFNSH